GERREDRIGVWIPRPERGAGHEDKIAAIGVRGRRVVGAHRNHPPSGPGLGPFFRAVALGGGGPRRRRTHVVGLVGAPGRADGVSEPRYGVTSLVDLGVPVSMPEVDMALRAEFEAVFGKTEDRGRMTENG